MLIFLSMSLVSALSTTPSYVILNNSVTSQQIEFSGLNESISLSLSSSISSYAYLNFYTVNPTEKWVTISLMSGVPAGSYLGNINYDGGSIPVGINIASSSPSSSSSGCEIEVFPTILTNIKVSQGDIKTRNVQISVPSCYSSYVKINGVSLATDEQPIQLGELSLGNIQPGDSVSVPITIDATDVATGQYSDTLQFSVYNSSGNKITVPSVSIGVYVSSGISPVTNNTFSTPPTCALSASTLNPNSTYTFTCSNVVANLLIEPQYSEYFEGKSVESSSNLYVYNFIPLKYGETYFTAVFKYNGAPIFQSFSQKVKITSTGSSGSGTILKLLFTPKITEATGSEDKFLIQIADNISGSLVNNPRVFVNAIELTKMNDSSVTFSYPFEVGKNYEIRGKADGYEDVVQNINITPNKINILISPGSGDTSTTFNITTSVENATLNIGGIDYTGSYLGSLSEGINEIKASMSGYKTEIINFTVSNGLRVMSFSGEFKKGIAQNFTLSRNASWIVYYKKSLDTQETKEYAKGNGDLVNFIPKSSGVYILEADGMNLGTYQTPTFSFSNKFLGIPYWVWLIVAIVVVIIIIVFIVARSNKDNYSSYDGGGMSFPVGGA
jgi:hypothetical protein